MNRSGVFVGLLWLSLSWATSTWADPAHYVVVEIGEDGRFVPVFHAEVDLVEPGSRQLSDAWSAPDPEYQRIGYRLIKDGVPGPDLAVEVPRILRAEFAEDPDGDDGHIVHHAHVQDSGRAFVLRIPIADADQVELVGPRGVQRLDLQAIARDAASLPLADMANVPVSVSARSGHDIDGSPGNPANRADILVLGDGYTSAQQATFNSHVAALHTSMFNVTPYKEYASFVNWTQGFVTSAQSGADHPPYQAGCTSASCCADTGAQTDPLAGTFVNTALDARFCTNQIHRLLTVDNAKTYAAAANYPNWDRILVVVNDPVYGGAGGAIGTTSAHPSGPLVVIHEYAHTFHRLADEYDSPYPGFPACSDTGGGPACEANVTNQSVGNLVKWRHWYNPSNIPIPTPPGNPGTGLFEGARYQSVGMYRPVDSSCLMRFLGTNFCSVCRQQYVKHLYAGSWGAGTSPLAGIDLIEPGTESPPHASPVSYPTGATMTFQAQLLQPSEGTLAVQWYLDGAPIPGATSSSHAFSQVAPTPATRALQLRVTDQTSFVHPQMADGLLVHSRTWTIQVSDDLLFRNGFQ